MDTLEKNQKQFSQKRPRQLTPESRQSVRRPNTFTACRPVPSDSPDSKPDVMPPFVFRFLTIEHFQALAEKGSLRKATETEMPGESIAECPFEFGVCNGYTLADICQFYASRDGLARGYVALCNDLGWSGEHLMKL